MGLSSCAVHDGGVGLASAGGDVRLWKAGEVMVRVYGSICRLWGPWRRLWVGADKLIARRVSNRFWGVLEALQAISAFCRYFDVRGTLVRGGGRREVCRGFFKPSVVLCLTRGGRGLIL